LVTLDEIRAAAERLRGRVIRTPLLPFRTASFLKPESLQPTGSFKIRGAFNALSQLDAEQRRLGVVAHSSGNHAQAVARAGRVLGIRVLVVMPNNAPQVKVAGVRADGAEIEFVGPHNAERVARAHEIAERDGMTLIPSANHRDVICGQGTIGLEILEQLTEMGSTDEATVLVPIGLGGIAAGIATAIKALAPAVVVIGVEPELAADTRESLQRGEPVTWPAEQTMRTMADGLRGESPAAVAFEHLKAYLDRVITVSEDQIGEAVAVAARETRLVLEPSGAASLAGLLARESDAPGGTSVAVLTGGNVDPARFMELLGSNV
jgi:threonine dehydratase